MRPDDFRSLTLQEIDGRVEEMRKQLFNYRIQMQSNQLSNSNLIRGIKRDIARAMTVRSELAQTADGEGS